MVKHKLVVLNPGHFHAALTLRERHPRLDDTVYVYAEDGPDVENFLRIVNTFNERSERPTQWSIQVYRGADFFERLLAERPGDVVVTSGKNDRKMQSIHRLHAEGFFVLGDKPWLIGEEDVPLLAPTTAGAPLAMDIMTERQVDTYRLQKRLASRPEIFGTWATDGADPAVSFHTVHHLYKIVNNAPLIRPAWFFDVAIQGEGMTDVTTHLVDLAQWMTGKDQPFDYDRDIELESARQWPTKVPLDKFSQITGLDDFPAALRPDVTDNVLDYLCNAQIAYRLRGVPVEIESFWALDLPEGGGDTHLSILRGTKALLSVELGPKTDFVSTLTVHPVTSGQSITTELEAALEDLDAQYPGLDLAADGESFRVVIPDALRTTHEEHFAAVLDEFLDYLDAGNWPANLGPDIVSKYTLLARARTLSHEAN
jgi:predicted dehydrogenase